MQPEFANIIEEVSPPDNYLIYTCQYPYGALILDKGTFQITTKSDGLIPLSHSSVSKETRANLDYTGTVPLSMVTSGAIETFLAVENRTIPSSLYTSGEMVSLWRVLEGDCSYQEGPLWNISAGARTICMLPKITDKSSYKLLKRKYKLKQSVPRSLIDHWEIFSNIANHPEFTQPWHTELLFFPKQWIAHKEDPAWRSFYHFLLRQAWQDCTFKRNQFIFDFTFSMTQRNKNLKPNPYLADTVKHLIGIGTGGPGLKPATNNTAAPIEGLQRTYIEDYGLKKYTPTIMHTHHFNLKENEAVYYSLETPTTTIFSPRSSRASSRMVDMRELKYIMQTFLSETLKGNLMMEKTPLYNIAQSVSYDFYHSDNDQFNEISNSNKLIKLDPSFQQTVYKTTGRAFPEFSSFFKGCISVSKSS